MFKHKSRVGSIGLATLMLGLAGLTLSACGGSSNTATAGANADATGTAGATGSAARPGPGHSAALRECLQKNGIALPQHPPGASAHHGFFGGGHLQLPNGVTRAQLEAAMKKCGAANFGNRGGHFGVSRLSNPAVRANLTKFAACMRENGVPLPPPNTSGSGPIFNTKGVDVGSPQFRAALAKCRSGLRQLTHPGGATGATGAG